MMVTGVKLTPRLVSYWFHRSLSCSEALFTLLNRAAGLRLESEEQAAHPLHGGLLQQGHACGMLWAGALAAGVRAQRLFSDPALAGPAALSAGRQVMEEFASLVAGINCREITACDLTAMSGRMGYLASGRYRDCRELAVAFAPRAHAAIDRALQRFRPENQGPPMLTCTQQLWRRVFGPERDSEGVIVAGLAGGLALSGNACGALAAGIWALGLDFYRRRQGERDSFRRSVLQTLGVDQKLSRRGARLRRAFLSQAGSEVCAELVSRRFGDLEEHSRFAAEGGCGELISHLASALQSHLARP